VVSNPYHFTRWWPEVTRIEAVSGDQFTMVIPTRKGRPMRVDYRVVESVEPEVHAWTQEVIGTPFERLLDESLTTLRIEPVGDRTQVQIELRQRMRGYARLGGWMLRRTNRQRLNSALATLASLVEEPLAAPDAT
jgi:hypothetical protein